MLHEPVHTSCKLTGYFPDGNLSSMEGGFRDMHGHALCTLQDFIDGRCAYVSVALDELCLVPYGTRLEIPELERFYGYLIDFRRVDCGNHFRGLGLTAADICVRTQMDSFDSTVNRVVALITHLEDSVLNGSAGRVDG